jgi:Uma2 family endonuclease
VTGEQRTILHGIALETYERLLSDYADRSSPRFTFDGGTLEIMTPFVSHERFNRAIEKIMTILALETGINISSFGSATYRNGESRGFEPDGSYYIGHHAPTTSKTIDLVTDPPPDIVVEVETTNPLLPKLDLLAALDVPEIWRAMTHGGSRSSCSMACRDYIWGRRQVARFPSSPPTP